MGERPFSSRGGPPASITRRRAVVAEQHPAVRAVLEHLLLREGYEVCCPVKAELSGSVLLLVSAGDGDGLYVLVTRDVAGTLSAAPERDILSRADGIHAFVPKPFGASDMLRVVRAVSAFDSRKKSPEKHAAG